MRTDEQVLHDRINLPRLMKRLEQSIQDGDWSKSSPPKRETWIKAQAMLQQIRHARCLLQNVELDSVDPTQVEKRRFQQYATTLKHLDDYMRQVEQQLTLPAHRPKPLLPTIPPPSPKAPISPVSISSEPHNPPVEATLIPIESAPSPSIPSVQNLLPASPISEPTRAPEPGPSHTSDIPLGAAAAPSSSKVTATPTILQNSRALQEELTGQLALMATQLRRNATHFSESLDKDKSILVAMQEKVEGNFDFMKRERVRLRDFRGKSGGTTCLVIMSVVVVLIAFILMVFVIRLT